MESIENIAYRISRNMLTRSRSNDLKHDAVSYADEDSEYECPAVTEIGLKDVMPFFNEEYVADDASVQKTIEANRKLNFEIRIRRLNKILPQIQTKWVTDEPLEYYLAYTMKNMDEEELMNALDDTKFLKLVKKEAKQKIQSAKKPLSKKAKKQIQTEITQAIIESQKEAESSSESDENDLSFSGTNHLTRRRPRKSYAEDDGDGEVTTTKKKPRRTAKPQTFKAPCPKGVSPEEWSTWSDARKHSYLQMRENPNSYLYRNLPPGEVQKNGKWSKEETKLFLERLEEFHKMGIYEGKWGIFSQKIPGRVGYQCSNYYRKLILDGVIKDDLYRKDADGNIHFKDRQSYQKKSWRAINGEPIETQKASDNDHDDNDNDDEEEQTFNYKGKLVGFYKNMAMLNPLKDKSDFITGEIIQVPAISPDGSVLDYNTWLNLLKTTKQDPFTLKHVNKRQLVILTFDNYDEYKDKIKHI